MPVFEKSRYGKSFAAIDERGRVYLGPRDPFVYRERPDNEIWLVRVGDTLESIAARKYAELSVLPVWSAANLWWVIADYQPRPIHDPTIALSPGERLVLPSVRLVREQILEK